MRGLGHPGTAHHRAPTGWRTPGARGAQACRSCSKPGEHGPVSPGCAHGPGGGTPGRPGASKVRVEHRRAARRPALFAGTPTSDSISHSYAAKALEIPDVGTQALHPPVLT